MSNYVKYPRTFHLTWTESVTADDKILKDVSHFRNKRVVVTEKMDGENTSMYSDHIHARSIDSKNHPSMDFVKQIHSQICYDIPKNWRVGTSSGKDRKNQQKYQIYLNNKNKFILYFLLKYTFLYISAKLILTSSKIE